MSDWQPSLLLHWYDRNPVSKIFGALYERIVPHVNVERFTYTCLIGKIAMVEVVSVKLKRRIAAAVEGQPHVFCTVTPLDGSEKKVVYGEIMTNDVGASDGDALGVTMMLMKGDNIKGYTGDNSVGGEINYFLSCKITEFDAEPPKDYVYVVDPTPKPDIQQPLAVKDPPM